MKTGKLSSTLVLLTTLSLLMPCTVAAVSDAYIEAVKLDINEFNTRTWDQPPDSKWFPSSQKSGADRSDSLDSFSTFLKKRFPGSFLLYSKLDPEDQNQVWQNYAKTGNLGGIRSDIFSLRKQARRKNRN